MSSSPSNVVRTMILAFSSSARIALIASTPSSSGIRRSSSVTSGRCSFQSSTASRPLLASWQGILALIGTMEVGDPVTVQRAYRCKSGEQKIVDARLTRENHAGRDLIVVFSRVVTEQKRLEPRSRQNEKDLTESQRFTNAGSTAQNVTEGTRIEEALRRSEEYLRLTIDTIPTSAWCNRPDGSNEFLNQRWLDYTGLAIEEARGRGWEVAIHPDDLPQLLDVWQGLLTSGTPGELEARLRRADGVYRWFLFRVEPLRDPQGTIVKW